MFVKKMVAIAAVALVSTAASAQTANNANDGFFGEVAYTAASYSANGLSGTWNPSALRGFVGKGFNENFAVEGMLLLGLADQSNLGVTLKLTSGAGVYLKPRVKLGDSFELFARLGWANINSKVGNVDARDNGGSYGAGASYSISKNISLNLDYLLFNNSNGSKIDGTSFGVGFKF